MKTLKITPPEGYEIDKEKSSFDEIVFKKVKKGLPDSWEKLGSVAGYYVSTGCQIFDVYAEMTENEHKNIFYSKAEAKASIALAQLSQLRAIARNEWVPNWEDPNKLKWVIRLDSLQGLRIDAFCYCNYYLSFQSKEIAEEFLEKYKNLIEDASPLLFG